MRLRETEINVGNVHTLSVLDLDSPRDRLCLQSFIQIRLFGIEIKAEKAG